ncbi:MAG: NAD(P)/FAD-dependent oxidoreductase, partial [Acidimicrobiales bacterium]
MGSLERYVDLVEQRGHDIGLDRTGTLTLLRTEEEWRWASATVEADRRAGRRLELLSSSELIDLEPAADPSLLGAMLDPLGARAEPVAATTAFAREAVGAGASILTDQSVEDIRPTAGGGWEVSTLAKGSGRVAVLGADAVIIAAGPWCRTLGAMAGLEIPIVAVRGQMWASAPQAPLLRHAIAAAESALAWSNEPPDGDMPPSLTHRDERRLTRHLYGRQRPGGEIVFGGDRVLTWDRTVDQDGITVNHGHVAELLPAVRQLPPARTWAGLMPFSIDGQPLIGPIPGHAGLFLAGGLASSGFGRGPMTGQLIADLVLGRDPGHDTTSVAPGRRIGPAM